MAIIGSPILLNGGRNSTYNSLFNFPISISSEEPIAKIEGHIWIDTTRGSNITSVHIVDSPTADIPNNSLIFEVYDTRNVGISLVQDFKFGNVGVVQMLYGSDAVGNHPWLVNSNGESKTYLAYPRVYIKLDDILYLETAYVWTGEYWMLLSQADKYLFSLYANNSNSSNASSYSYCPINIYNITDDTYGSHINIADATKNRGCCISVSDANGMYVAYHDSDNAIHVYKRVGDTFSLYFTMSKTDLVNYLPEEYASYYFCQPKAYSGKQTLKLSATGDYLAITFLTQPESEFNISGRVSSGVLILKNNGTTYVYHNHFIVSYVSSYGGSNGIYNSNCYVNASDDFSVMMVESSLYSYTPNSDSYRYNRNHVLIGSPDSYTSTSISTNDMLMSALSKDGSCAVVEVKESSSYYYYVYSIDKNSNSVKRLGNLYYRSSYQVVRDLYISSDNNIWLVRQSNSTSGEVAYIEHGKVENGVFTKLTNNYVMTDGNGKNIYASYSSDVSGSSFTYNDMCIDVKNNILYISTRSGIYACDMTKGDNGSLSSYTLKYTIPSVASYVVHGAIAITPNLAM